MAAKLPPSNTEAEQAILGGLLIDKDALDEVTDLLSGQDFYVPANQKLFDAIKELHAKGQAVDIVTITNHLQAKSLLFEIGGYDYLVSLFDKSFTSANIGDHAQIVKDKSMSRRLIQATTHIIEKAYSQDFPSVEELIDFAEGEIFKLSESGKTSGLSGSMDIIKEAIQQLEERYQRKADITGLATGFRELDKMTAGMHGGELTIIAARPSMGKTAFALNLAEHVSLRQKKTVAFFSLEMGKVSLMQRILSSEAKVSMSDLRTGRIQDALWPKLIHSASILAEAPLYIDDSAGLSPFEIRARCRRLKAKHGLDCIMIDYLQLMDLKQKVESRERAVSEISKSLKMIAKEMNIPVIALAQLNRSVESRSDRRPMLSDLRESGSIEQDADVIMMLYRDEYYDKDDPEKQGAAEVIIGKQRNGPTGTVKLKFEAKYNRFRDADPEHYSGSQSAPQIPPQAISQPPPSSSGGPGTSQKGGGKPRNFAPGASS